MKKPLIALILTFLISISASAQTPYAFLLVSTPDDVSISVNGMPSIIVKASTSVNRIPVERGDNLVEFTAISPPARAYSVVLNFPEPTNKFFKVDFTKRGQNTQSSLYENPKELLQKKDVVEEDLSPYLKSVQKTVSSPSPSIGIVQNNENSNVSSDREKQIEKERKKEKRKKIFNGCYAVLAIAALFHAIFIL
jgi:hypothetical protein